MADAKVRSSKRGVPAKKALKKHAFKTAAKHAAKKAAKKLVKKAAKTSARDVGMTSMASTQHHEDFGLVTAFHHMQRATVVISLMKRGSGEDLHGLLDRGVEFYERARKAQDGDQDVLRAIGLLRAAEHLAMAGLYEARRKHRQRVDVPSERVMTELVRETDRRLDAVEHAERSKGTDLYPVTRELLRQAEDLAEEDAHLAFELAMAADALCFALENGL